MRITLLLGITAALPIAWLVAEFKARPGVRRTLGIVTLLWSFGVASLVGVLRDFNANVYFTGATKDLLEASVSTLKTGKTDGVIREWTRASEEFHPTYENRAHYRQIVDQAMEGMKKP
jgi:hypothetical protein